ncbi:hypothetical protein HUT16_33970 [Kitasatospora sp. NA04385]|uniref:DUF6882 domain-containing protein n=1 Tax=Kitasatospora sp. NA04385 TaxID=2742135 RepID=UPI0015914C0B|nr:DUF6882 domain-containing protein [Kitasatospora sp. NA04385]QKW23430.1 hypothetical protein HUT16_33970 [Kitasatospora sp. NA04385]
MRIDVVEESDGGAGAELEALVAEGFERIDRLAEAHVQWGLGTADRWGLDQRTGLITWTFPDRTAVAAAQILATWSPRGESWMWSWANGSILPGLSRDARAVRDWAGARGHAALTTPTLDADAGAAAALAALAVRVTRAAGFYRGPGDRSHTIITFGPVTLTGPDGATSTRTVEVG